MVHTLPKFGSEKMQEARLNSYKTCSAGHVGIKQEVMEKANCATSMRRHKNTSLVHY